MGPPWENLGLLTERNQRSGQKIQRTATGSCGFRGLIRDEIMEIWVTPHRLRANALLCGTQTAHISSSLSDLPLGSHLHPDPKGF